MSNVPSTSRSGNNAFEEDEIFEDSSFLANFENTSFKTSRFSESIINDSFDTSALNVSALCCDEELSGYDKLTGQTWIYPTNYPVRDYQFNIISAALLKNTLVSLPTGLGKTFIAAVIMYNFYRWYPLGKIVFTAPTRPLVAQQIDACYNIVAIPPDDTIEMTGHMQVNTRKTQWQNKRVFFATPQVIYNDIKSGICPADKIRCLVIDEAHRARGNYAYCQIVATLDDKGCKTYRMLALSATPGNKVEDVVNVVKSLHIAHLELRTENCIDVAPYSHSRKIHTVVVPLGAELSQLRQQYVEILDTYARRLKQLGILPHNVGNLSKGRVVMLYKEFQAKERGQRHPQHNYIMKDFTVLIALYHGLELLVKHGSRVFLNFFDEHPEKTWIQADDQLTALLERLRDDLGVNPMSLDRSVLPDGTVPEMPKNLCFGHPKFYKLKEIMLEHFNVAKRKGQDTKAIVFCEYRESVHLVHCLLLQCRPLIEPLTFVGQGASGKDGKAAVSQKQQLRVMRSFRAGACNTLVATCVAEEGLDVGAVDLILCFDVSTRSPARLVQRCGRTGRERAGQVFILVTEGREHQTLVDSIRQRDGLTRRVLHSADVQRALFARNPRLLPRAHAPRCQKMHITVAAHKRADEKASKGQQDLRSMLGRGRGAREPAAALISEAEFRALFPSGLPPEPRDEGRECWAMSKEKYLEAPPPRPPAYLEWQRALHAPAHAGHSRDSDLLVELLQLADARRLLGPSSQHPVFNTQDLATQPPVKINSPAKPKQTKKKQKVQKSPAKKDGDIRALFSTATKSTTNYTKLINDLGIPNDGSIPNSLVSLLVDLSLNTNIERKCYICQNICDCKLIKSRKNDKKEPILLSFLNQPRFPDVSLIDDVDSETILKCAEKKLDNTLHVLEVTNIKDQNNRSSNFDLEFDFDSPTGLTSPENVVQDTEAKDKSEDKNFDLGDIEDIFADSSPEEAIAKDNVVDDAGNKEIDIKTNDNKDIEVKREPDAKDALGFFGLDSIDDIFADYEDSDIIEVKSPEPTPNVITSSKLEVARPQFNANNKIQDTKSDDSQIVEPLSPSILSGRSKGINSSPILCSQARKFQLSTKKNRPNASTPITTAKKQLHLDGPTNNNSMMKNTIENSKSLNNVTANNKSMFTITQLVNMINTTNTSANNATNVSKTVNEKPFDIIERSTSPILLTQAERKKSPLFKFNKTPKPNSTSQSLIILDSDDSDSNDVTQIYDVDTESKIFGSKTSIEKSPIFNKTQLNADSNVSIERSPTNNKRKLDTTEATSSPYFKRQKLEIADNHKTLQQKVLAALSTNKAKSDATYNNDKTSLHFTLSQPNFLSQKENKYPEFKNKDFTFVNDSQKSNKMNSLDMLQQFRRDNKIQNVVRNKFDAIFKKSPEINTSPVKKTISFDDSDDDFVVNDRSSSPQRAHNSPSSPAVSRHRTTKNHKVRKKKQANSFLDLEASQSGSGSGDELSDGSAGSVADFICDEDVTHEDVRHVYLQSVRSPVKNGFKIPALPTKFKNMDVFSQYVEEDTYEMDSFCVDSHIGLTQANDVSELELAEIVLEEERRAKKKRKERIAEDADDSPVVRRKKVAKRRISSDSDESS